MKFILPLLAMLLILIFASTKPGSELQWTMVNVNSANLQGDAHLIQVARGKTILIDTGYSGEAQTNLIPYLRNHGIKKLDTVFISHPHKDHYQGIYTLLQNNITLKEIYFNIPDKDTCDKEIPWGCDFADILNLHQKLKNHHIPIRQAEAGQKFNLGKDTWIEILYAFDGVNTPVGKTDINDLSLVMMLHHRQYKFLFTGDLNHKLGSWIANQPVDITADIIKVPHHGTETTVPDSFFEKVAPGAALVPSPAHLWQSKRSQRIHNWFTRNTIPVYVNGLSGNIKVTVTNNTLKIIPQSTH